MITVEHIVFLALLVLFYGLFSKKLASAVVTGPMAFLGFGMLLAPEAARLVGFEPLLDMPREIDATVHTLGEITLVVVLFADAAQISLASLRRGASLPARLLGIGMPLSILFGALTAWLFFPSLGVWELMLIGAMLAPTDAALGQAVVTDERVPVRIRQGLSVESGLNDGIAVPLVLLFGALASIGQTSGDGHIGEAGGEVSDALCLSFSLEQILLGPLVGAAVAWAGSRLLDAALRRGWIEHAYQEFSGIALAILAFAIAGLVGGNGFIAAFVAGIVVGNGPKRVVSGLFDFAEAESTLLMLATFFLVGLGLIWTPLGDAGWREWAYALASLTLIRAVPVAISLIGTGFRAPTVLFLGWFGPRGLASVLFALLVIDELPVPHAELIVRVTMLTVLLSTLLHGLTAAPLSALYARYTDRATHPECPEHAPCAAGLQRKSALGHKEPDGNGADAAAAGRA